MFGERKREDDLKSKFLSTVSLQLIQRDRVYQTFYILWLRPECVYVPHERVSNFESK